jgi:succinate dehydrogenase / fumarate reductase, membrane anchor subunit
MTYRTPLGNARGLGSAKSGAHHWWMQRLTAVALVPLTLWFILSVIQLAGADYQMAVVWISSPTNSVLMLLLIAATFHHMQLGLQVVIEDYVQGEGTKIIGIVFVKLISVLLAAAAAFAVLKIAFGG